MAWYETHHTVIFSSLIHRNKVVKHSDIWRSVPSSWWGIHLCLFNLGPGESSRPSSCFTESQSGVIRSHRGAISPSCQNAQMKLGILFILQTAFTLENLFPITVCLTVTHALLPSAQQHLCSWSWAAELRGCHKSFTFPWHDLPQYYYGYSSSNAAALQYNTILYVAFHKLNCKYWHKIKL